MYKSQLTAPTKAQLQKRIDNSVLMINKGQHYKAFHFDDMGYTVHVCSDYAVISTPFHHTVFKYYPNEEVSYNNPYIYFNIFVDIANKYKDKIQDKNVNGEVIYSLHKLKNLTEVEDAEKIIIDKIETYFYLLFDPMYLLGNTDFDSANMLVRLICFYAYKNAFLFAEEGDIKNNELFNNIISEIRWLSLRQEKDASKRLARKDIDDIEKEAMDKMCALVKERGQEMDNPVLFKRISDEALAMKDMMKGNDISATTEPKEEDKKNKEEEKENPEPGKEESSDLF